MLENIIKKETRNLQGQVGIYYRNLQTGKTIQVGNDVFMSASVIKIWIMGEAFRQIEDGKITENQVIHLKESDKVPSSELMDYNDLRCNDKLSSDMFPESGVLNLMHTGMELTIGDLIYLMITISDNTATNMLIDFLGFNNINIFIEECGMKETKLNRKLFDTNKSNKGLENMISLSETGKYLEMIFKGELISKKASKKMSAILQNQQNTYKIPFYLTNIPVAHKTGEDNRIVNDVGIIYGVKPFILCFAGNDVEVPMTELACQNIAKAAYDLTI